MSNSAEIFVREASTKASWMVQRESRGPGDLPNAMRRLEQRYGISYHVLQSLRYRKPQDILASVYARICEAYEAERGRQLRLLEHECSIEDAKTRFGRAVMAEAESVVREEGGAVKQ